MVETAAPEIVLETRGLGVATRERPLVRQASLRIPARHVFGLIGPSGVGKSTLLRAFNRLTDLDPHLRVSGEVLLHGRSIFGAGVDVDALRARVGILFQQPVVFPTSIGRNVIFAARQLRSLTRASAAELTERALREAALWDEVKDRLEAPAAKLSVGQQQRLCLARTLALDPEIILMDEPTSALDAVSTAAIEQLILRLKLTRTVVLVTHNLGQARRVVDTLACLALRDGAGEVVAIGPAKEVLARVAPEDAAESFEFS